MKLNQKAFANASGILGAGFFIICFIVASIIPGLYKTILESWMHILNLSGLWRGVPGNFLLGLISFTVVSWITGWLFAWLYNKFIK